MKSPKATNKIIGKFILFLFLFISLLSNVEAQQRSFPTAYGAGAYSVGGRGGNVYHVTSLEDNNSVGTFRWAVAQARPATIVFDVSGTINLTSTIVISGKNLTIAGQTSPVGGITFTASDPSVVFRLWNVEDMILRFLRFRYQRDNNNIGIDVYGNHGNARNLIFDHLSISYAGWTGFGCRGSNNYNVTVQNTLIAECKTGAIFGDPDTPSFSYNNSFLNNFFYNVSHRFPNPSAIGRVDVINNVTQNHYYRLSRPQGGVLLNHINNYHAAGAHSALWLEELNQVDSSQDNLIYTSGNVIDKGLFSGSDNKLIWAEFNGGSAVKYAPSSEFTNSMYPLLGVPPIVKTAQEAYKAIVSFPTVGNSKSLNADGTVSSNYDKNDASYLSKTAEGEGAYEAYTAGQDGKDRSFFYEDRYNNFLATISTTPVNSRPKNFYVSNPHIPEAFFKAHVPAGQNHNDIAPSGYTWLEEYLNGVDGVITSVGVKSIEVAPNSAELQLSETLQLAATIIPANATNKNGTWSSSNNGIAKVNTNGLVTPVSEGEVTITFTSTDGSHKGTSLITVLPEALKVSAGSDQSICAGTSATLTATGGSTYLWSTGAKTASITVSPNQTTTYTVTAYDSTGNNSDTDEVQVTVNALPTVDAGNNVTINSGESTTLTAKGGTTYKWSTGATTASITVRPTATTIYTVTGTRNGCEATGTVRVTVVNPVGVTADAGADQSICVGTSATLTATGGSTYLWSTGAKTASITVSPNQTTTYTVTAYDSTGNNSDTDEVQVTVNALPTVDAGSNVTINSGESTVLTAKGGTTYKWSTGATTASITVRPTASQTYTVTGTTNGCEATDTVRVTVVNPVGVTADAGADQSICTGTNATLTATGGSTYLWSTGAKTASITVSPNQTTTYTVTAYDTTGKNSDTDEVKVTVNPLPTVDAGSNVTINSGESTVLTAKGGTTYKWSTGATTASITVRPTASQTYTVTGKTNGCEATDTVRVTVVNQVGVTADAGADQSICEGTSATLTATGGSSYLWSTGAKTASITVSPNQTTTYTVTAYDSTGKNSDTDEVKVTVNALPIVDAGSNVTINSGESTTLTATGASTYKWSTGAPGANITVRPTTTTTYTVTGTRNGCEATDTVKVTVVNPLKVVANVVGSQDVCHGSSVKLTATGGDTYLWSTGAKTASITVNPSATTKYSVTAYIGNASDTAETVVNVSPNPDVKITNGSEASILEGEFITLSATGAKTYKWNNGATQPNIAVRPNATQIYSVTGHDNKCAAERSIKVNVFEKIVADAGSDVTIYRNEKTTLTAKGPKNSEFLWSTGETTRSITVSPLEDTEYSVMVYHDLDSDTANVTVKVIDLVDDNVMEDSAPLEFLIHPNPTHGELNIKISGLTNLSSIHLYDLSGKSLYNEIINESDHQSYNKKLNLSNYASGVYLLQLVDNQRVITKKVVVR